jgi:membrane protein
VTERSAGPWYRRLFDLLVAAGKEFGSDSASRWAASLAYYTVFAAVPLLVLAVSVAGFVFGTQAATGAISDQLTEFLGAQLAGIVEDLLVQAFETRYASGLTGLALAVWTGSGLFLQLQAALNHIFHAPEKRFEGVRGMVVQRLVAFSAAVGIGLVLLALLAANTGLAVLTTDVLPASWAGALPLLRFVGPVVSVLLLIVVFSLMFQYLTTVQLPWQAVRRGAAFTGITFVVGAVVAGIYLGRLARGEGSVFAAVGSLAVLMVLVYLLGQIFLFGAEVTKVYLDYLKFGDILAPHERSRDDQEQVRGEPPPRPVVQLPRSTALAFLLGMLVGRGRR